MTLKEVKIGCCGFPVSMSRYFQEFRLVEVQSTFYKLIQKRTAKRWRDAAPQDFEFVIKAFQGITHDVRSPTWKRSNIKDYKILKDKVGSLRLTKEVLNFWEHTIKIAKILKSKIVLVQLPRSFRDTKENIKRAELFFKNINLNDIRVAIELRGWSKESRKWFCEEFDLIDVVDPLVESPAYMSDIVYFRLHGRHEKERIVYKHKYSDKELRALRDTLTSYLEREIYVLFNNTNMYEDAKRFLEMIK
ncbi:MAG: DUF72 domain-containing protein [Euryarchaeota archaeon]|nr:DUF72 domain-containing protein [Euryarchaeota archaeon]